jgi:hypothetical protein
MVVLVFKMQGKQPPNLRVVSQLNAVVERGTNLQGKRLESQKGGGGGAQEHYMGKCMRLGLQMSGEPVGEDREAPVLSISGVEILFPNFTTWERPVRKSRTQLHRAQSRTRVSSLMTSLEGTMVLNAEL